MSDLASFFNLMKANWIRAVFENNYFFRLLPLGIATVGDLPPSHPIPGISLCHNSLVHVLLHYIR